jgi:uncharacterized protein YkwD
MPWIPWVCLLPLMLLVSLGTLAASEPVEPLTLSADELDLAAGLNQQRRQRGLPGLALRGDWVTLAQQEAAFLARHGRSSARTTPGLTFAVVRYAGEGQGSPFEAFWRAASESPASLLVQQPNVRELGLGLARARETGEIHAVLAWQDAAPETVAPPPVVPEGVAVESEPSEPSGTAEPATDAAGFALEVAEEVLQPLPERTLPEIVQLLHARINQERSERGLPALRLDPGLNEVAQGHADYLASKGILTHTGPRGDSVKDRVSARRLPWRMLAENVARYQGHLDPAEQAYDAWIHSPGHRENMFNEDFTHTGLGVSQGVAGDEYYFTQIFLKIPSKPSE